ncbi:glutamate-1-semialdehyde 2,1-aminomutase, putative chloroplast precursor [Tribonema minus]|uniref:glutamate-1-semialdehyde 2,1-aminomutase n=1 Tax=Tribonema minus TaxID=303371 RepID=A0A835YR28_9STRA|nr:glutamate-1-semialdehyde 2,1-aminomutase, putative chloroplast precursor [Tribonema minus]
MQATALSCVLAAFLALSGSETEAFSAGSAFAGVRARGARATNGRMSMVAATKYNTAKSEAIFTEAKDLMPGGVSSPVRAFKSVGGNPIVFDKVKGAYSWDVDGNKYIDYVGSWGPAIVGHAHDEVLDAVKATMDKGTSFGAPCALENELAKKVIEAVPSVEMVRFTNSGTEACMGMLRLVRAFTGKEKIIKFNGCYHGHADGFLVQAGSGIATLGLPDSPGVPQGATAGTLVAKYNDLASVEELLKTGGVAAVVLEPVVGNSGFIPPQPGFLQGLRDLTNQYDALLVFDEVMTGFRIAYGCAQAHFGVTPDVTTLGKVIGGGLPVGAYGGRRDIMEMVAPAGPMYQAGTLSGNPLAMMAGIKTMEILQRPGSYEHLDKVTSKLIKGILSAGADAGHDVCGGSISGMFGFFFAKGPVYSFEDAQTSDLAKFGRWHRAMLEKGVYLAPSQYEAGFTSLAHTEADIDATIAAAKDVMSSL